MAMERRSVFFGGGVKFQRKQPVEAGGDDYKRTLPQRSQGAGPARLMSDGAVAVQQSRGENPMMGLVSIFEYLEKRCTNTNVLLV